MLTQHHLNTSGLSQEELIVACSVPVKAIAWSFVRSSNGRVDVDEMYSVGMLEVCEAVAAGRGVNADDPVPYLCKVARYAMCAEWRRLQGNLTVSLDAPFTSDTSLTLQDFLPAEAPVPAVSSQCIQALNEALCRLRSHRQRDVLRHRFGLEGYGPSSLKKTAVSLNTTAGAVNCVAIRGLRRLARDARLCAAIGLGGSEQNRSVLLGLNILKEQGVQL